MKTSTQMKLWFLGAALIVAGFAGSLNAASVDIHVSINASKSLQAMTTMYYFGAVDVNSSSYSATELVIRNTSGALIETYKLSAGNAISDTSGTDWILDTAPAKDKYVLSAQFGAARPADAADGTWGSDDLTSTPTDCTDAAFGNGAPGETGKDVSPLAAGNARDKNLWFRIKTPTEVSDGGGHTALVTLSVK